MTDYQTRAKEEFSQLMDRLIKLTVFMLSPSFDDLDPIEQILLIKQAMAMSQYAEVLRVRISRFKEPA